MPVCHGHCPELFVVYNLCFDLQITVGFFLGNVAVICYSHAKRTLPRLYAGKVKLMAIVVLSQ